MYTSRDTRLAGARRTAALLTLALAAACGDGVTDGRPGSPGQPGTTPPDTTPVVAWVEITPGTLQLPVEGTRALSATVRTSTGRELTGRVLSWTSSDPEVVRVDINGNATALKVGTSVITAAIEGRQGQSTIEVTPPPAPPAVAHVQVLGDTQGLEPGETRLLAAVPRAANGEVLYGRQVTWSSSDSSVVRVLAGGEVLGGRGGTATITATSEGRTGSLTFVIPQWLQFGLASADGKALPVVLETSADTTDRTAYSMVVTEYRQRLAVGTLWLSTVDWRYRQRYDLQLWKRTVSYLNGNAMTGPEELIQVRTIRDEGVAEMFDVFTGDPIYESTQLGGHSFRVYRTEGRGRLISQRLPGATEAAYDLRFTR
ncbi:MAG TPA: Ig-like domain-containing protein [Longimicrobium sp.]